MTNPRATSQAKLSNRRVVTCNSRVVLGENRPCSSQLPLACSTGSELSVDRTPTTTFDLLDMSWKRCGTSTHQHAADAINQSTDSHQCPRQRLLFVCTAQCRPRASSRSHGKNVTQFGPSIIGACRLVRISRGQTYVNDP